MVKTNSKLYLFFIHYYLEYLKLHPQFASSIGFTRFKNLDTDDYSDESYVRKKNLSENYLKKSMSFDSKNMDLSDKLNLESFQYFIKTDIDGYSYNFKYLVFNKNYNPFADLLNYLDNEDILQSTSELNNIVERLHFFDKCYKNYLDLAKEGIKKGITHSNLEINIFINYLNTILEKKEYIKKGSFLSDNYHDLVQQHFVNTIHKTIDFINNEYKNHCRKTMGLLGLKNGKTMYKYHLDYYTTRKELTPEKIFNIGKKAVDKLLPNIRKNRKKFEPVYCESAEELLFIYEKQKNIVNSKLDDLFIHYNNVETDYDITSVNKKNTAAAYYVNPKIDSSNKGTFYVNSYNIKDHPIHKMQSLTVHEGAPGHHFQIVKSYNNNVPLFRIYSGLSFYFEGWALYCESIFDYTTPENRWGFEEYELLRAVRLMTDVGVNHYGWSYKKTFDFMSSVTDLSETDIRTEIIRYISNPGQAVSYFIGYQSVLEIKNKFLKKYSNENSKSFNQKMVDVGPLPYYLLKKAVIQ